MKTFKLLMALMVLTIYSTIILFILSFFEKTKYIGHWWIWSGVVLLAVWFLTTVLATVAMNGAIHPPQCMHKFLFGIMQGYFIKVEAKKLGPLLAWPFIIFLELELPTIFEKEGLYGARKALAEYPAKLQERFKNAFKDINFNIDRLDEVDNKS